MKPLRVGITGGMGSGKSFVARIIEKEGFPVFFADAEAKKAFNDENIKRRLKELFGNKIFSSSGELLRQNLAKKVFTHQEKLQQLNQLIHPFVKKRFRRWCVQQKEALVFIEAAILVESGFLAEVDKVLFVEAPLLLRLQRLQKRDNAPWTRLIERIQNQLPATQLFLFSDYIVFNDLHCEVSTQVHAILSQLLTLMR